VAPARLALSIFDSAYRAVDISFRTFAFKMIEQESLLPATQGLQWSENEEVPTWAYDMRSVKDEGFHNEEMHPPNVADRLAGYAWPYAFKALMLLWGFWLTFPNLTIVLAECKGPGFAAVPVWLLAIYLPILGAAVILEVRCNACMLPVYVKFLGPYKLMGRTIPFRVYFIGVMILSILAHLDLATSGMFLGRLLKTSMCPESKVPQIWSQVLSQSSVPWLPNLAILGTVAWLAMLSQLMYALAVGLPTNWSTFNTLYEGDINNQLRGKLWATYDTLFVKGVETEDALLALADASRMSSLGFRSTDFMFLDNGKAHLTKGMHFGKRCMSLSPALVHKFVDSCSTVIMKSSLRVAFFLLLESSVQTNLQGSVLAVEKAASGNAVKVDKVTAVSVLLSLLVAINNLCTTSRFLYRLLSALRLASAMGIESKCKVFISISIYVVSAVTTTMLVLYAAAKVIAAVYICDLGVWNLSGCASVTLSS